MVYLRGSNRFIKAPPRPKGLRGNQALLQQIRNHNSNYVTKKQLLAVAGKGTQRVHGFQLLGQTKTAAVVHQYDIGQSIAKGVDAGDRSSDKIWLTGFRYNITLTNTSSLTAKFFRLAVVKVSNPNQSINAQFFEACGATNSPQDYDVSAGLPRPLYHTWSLNKQKFNAIYHNKWRAIPIADNTITGKDQNVVHLSGFVKLPNIPVNYNNSGTASESLYPQLRLVYFLNDKNGTTTASLEKDSQYFTYFKS
jgi:hypothetical protein